MDAVDNCQNIIVKHECAFRIRDDGICAFRVVSPEIDTCDGFYFDLPISDNAGGGTIKICISGVVNAIDSSYMSTKTYNVVDQCPPPSIDYGEGDEDLIGQISAYGEDGVFLFTVAAAPAGRYLLAPADGDYIGVVGATAFSTPVYIINVYSSDNAGGGIIAVANGGCSVYVTDEEGSCDDLIAFTDCVEAHPEKPAQINIMSNGPGKIPIVDFVY